ncbi:hypothetical protein RRF57_004748 [Xylaria bambusicola]|uniref:Uncharacterized protein n=1 Tax=Xylaria bambusicola TaxID=326684 RepID=A0AAN7Z738_9PEZI
MDDELGKRQFDKPKSVAFERLLRSIRDRMIVQEIERLELIITKLQSGNLSSARDDLREIAESKTRAKIDIEAETFRAIDLDVRAERLELAIESLEEFIEASRDRMKVSPFDEEVNIWALSDPESEHSGDLSEDDASESDLHQNPSDESVPPEDIEDRDDEDQEEDGWETAEEGV